ncbi:hypothetical protein Tco_0353752, partial [Tanacetum coccineum]
MASLDIGKGPNNICGGHGPLIDTLENQFLEKEVRGLIDDDNGSFNRFRKRKKRISLHKLHPEKPTEMQQ